MKDLEVLIKEVAANLSEKDVVDAQQRAESLMKETTINGMMAKLNMIAWDQQ